MIRNWRVLDEHFFLGHRYIQFDLDGVPSMLHPMRNIKNTD